MPPQDAPAPDATFRMPGPQGRQSGSNMGALPPSANDMTFTAPPPVAGRLDAPPPPPPPQTASEENPMLAKTSALSPEKRRLGRALLAAGPITQERLQEELEKSGKSQSVLGKALLKSNFPKEDDLLAALVATIRIPKINVRNTKIPLETIRIVPADVARRWKVLPIEKIGEILVIVSPGLGEEDALAAVRKATGCSVFPFQCDAEGFEEVLEGYYERVGSMPAASPSGLEPIGGSPPPAPRPASGAMAALPATDDEWDRVYAAPGPVPAEEVLL
jgi:hypothetical protein